MVNDFYPLIAAFTAALLAQLIKPFYYLVRNKRFDIYQVMASGGFPSSHTALTSALALSFGLKIGFDSSAFMISFVYMAIVAYDAMNVRLYAGKHIQLTKQLVEDIKNLDIVKMSSPIYLTKMKEILGHERFEVFGGLILGVIVSLSLFYLI